MKWWELKNRIQKFGEGLQDYAADIRCLVQEAYSSIDPEFVESVAVDSIVDGIQDWEMQSLVQMHSCKNITATLAYALEVETAKRASYRPVLIYQLKEKPKEPKSSSKKGEKLEYQLIVPPGGK